ncbi:SDR family oxidoreductase [Allobranchiibius huperziae]|uniref:NAD(P)-dependent dehydrogenase (Short-subunit alcohol dehydrogenase family) n=1 Tax=Allobranchiibius huperziae TaxID=1874116 RepID=A0A853DF64_9MICO|nr:SDR family oxidoreductase [Allobranchiibius huperziae]NYJ74609.1 NAD(P)-dependent dehydrogenase (short-subunit alcohol dehydrogenase family) [Allobranchiibius huperziae]
MSAPAAGAQTVVVTGAARGIGAAIATRMAADGARVVVSDRDGDELRELAARIGAHPVVADIASDGGVQQLVDAALETLGRIDVFFANAGIALGTGLSDTDDGHWATILDINVLAHVRAARALESVWEKQGGGRFVVTASAAGLLTILDDPSYAVTKHAAVAFAEWLSVTYRHRGVVVQAICPQGVQTRMLEASGELEELLSHDQALPPERVADAVATALTTEDFYILPHPEVAGYAALRSAEPDRWLAGMNKLQRKLEDARATRDGG